MTLLPLENKHLQDRIDLLEQCYALYVKQVTSIPRPQYKNGSFEDGCDKKVILSSKVGIRIARKSYTRFIG
jgi:hypothetical protein